MVCMSALSSRVKPHVSSSMLARTSNSDVSKSYSEMITPSILSNSVRKEDRLNINALLVLNEIARGGLFTIFTGLVVFHLSNSS